MAVSRLSAMSGIADSHKIARLHIARNRSPRKSHANGAPMGVSNQMLLRISSSSTPTSGFLIDGKTIINGINMMTFRTPSRANNSETRDRGLLQWLLVNRNATAARGAAPVTMNRNMNMAA